MLGQENVTRCETILGNSSKTYGTAWVKVTKSLWVHLGHIQMLYLEVQEVRWGKKWLPDVTQ